jgi:hypothetical protein
LSDNVLASAAKYEQDIAMRRVGIVVKRLDPPITFSAHLSSCAQNDRWELLPGIRCLNSSDEAVPTMGVAQLAFAPLLLSDEQTLHSPEFHKQRVFGKFHTIKRHLGAPHSG